MLSRARRLAYLCFVAWAALLAVAFFLRPSQSTPMIDAPELTQEITLLEEEVRSLRSLLGLRESWSNVGHYGFEPRAARVLPVADLSPGRKSVLVDVGSTDGVVEGAGVVTHAGIFGQVVEVGPHFSRVKLADDPTFRVRFTARHRDFEGVLEGGPTPGVLSVLYLRDPLHERDTNTDPDSDPDRTNETVEDSPGEVLLTAGRDGVFPRGVLIGTLDPDDESGRRPHVALSYEIGDASEVVLLLPPKVNTRFTTHEGEE